jgi:hypothetical protein
MFSFEKNTARRSTLPFSRSGNLDLIRRGAGLFYTSRQIITREGYAKD